MRVERRGRVVLVRWLVNRCFREEPDERIEIEIAGQTVRYFQVAGMGGVSQGQGEQRGAGCRRGDDRTIRTGSAKQSVQVVESTVVGILLPSSGESRGDSEAGRTWCPRARGAHGGRPDRPDGGGHGAGGEGRADLPSGLLRLPVWSVRVGCGRGVQEALLAIRLGDRCGHSGVLRQRGLGVDAQSGRTAYWRGAEVDPALCAAVARRAGATP